MNYTKYLMFLVCLFVITACNQNQKVKDSQMSLMKTTNPAPITTDKKKGGERAEDIQREINSIPEIYDVAVVKGKKETLVVYKVKHLQRFRMKNIEQKINKKLEQKYPNENFTVSSDYKIFLEAIRLDERIKTDKNFSKAQAEKRLKQIIKMSQEMT